MTAGTNAREFILMPEDPIKHRFASMKKKKNEQKPGVQIVRQTDLTQPAAQKWQLIRHCDYVV